MPKSSGRSNGVLPLQHDARQLAAQSRQLEAAREELLLTQIKFGTGLLDYIDDVVVNTQYDQATIGYIGVKAQRLQDTPSSSPLAAAGGAKPARPPGAETETPPA